MTKKATADKEALVDVCPNDGRKKADGLKLTRGEHATVECPCGYVFSSEPIEATE